MTPLQQNLFEREISYIDEQLHRLKMQAKRIGKHAVWGDDTLGNHIKNYEEKRAALMRELGDRSITNMSGE